MPAYATTILGAMRANIDASGAVYDGQQLRNVFTTSMWVDEIRFFAVPNGSITGGNPLLNPYKPVDFFSALGVEFKTRNCVISESPVEIDLLCTDFQTDLEQEITPQVALKYKASYRRWIPPSPLWLPPGDTLNARVVQLNTLASTSGLDVWIVYLGRITDEPVPDKVQVPYVLQFQQTTGIGPNDPPEIQVPIRQMQNPLTVPLRVQRIVSRLYIGGGAPAGLPPPGMDVLRDIPDLCSIQVSDSFQYHVTNDWLPLGVFVDPQRRAWTFIRDLAPKGYLNIRFRREQLGNLGTFNYNNITILPGIALICTREESVR